MFQFQVLFGALREAALRAPSATITPDAEESEPQSWVYVPSVLAAMLDERGDDHDHVGSAGSPRH